MLILTPSHPHTLTYTFNYTHAGCSLALPALPPSLPPPPKVAARGKTSLTLRWNAPADNGSPITQYCLEWDQVRAYMHVGSQHLRGEKRGEGRRGGREEGSKGGGRGEEITECRERSCSSLLSHPHPITSSSHHTLTPSHSVEKSLLHCTMARRNIISSRDAFLQDHSPSSGLRPATVWDGGR